MSQNTASLVKYNTPILVNTTGGAKGKKGVKKPEKETTQTEDILNSILPPREWTEDGHLWVQYVSSTPATRLDVVNLQERLDHQLQSRQARETGICPIREELYSQCFDELIRQITINCAERGLLLLRVRDVWLTDAILINPTILVPYPRNPISRISIYPLSVTYRLIPVISSPSLPLSCDIISCHRYVMKLV